MLGLLDVLATTMRVSADGQRRSGFRSVFRATRGFDCVAPNLVLERRVQCVAVTCFGEDQTIVAGEARDRGTPTNDIDNAKPYNIC